jgi:hypothetical protein
MLFGKDGGLLHLGDKLAVGPEFVSIPFYS